MNQHRLISKEFWHHFTSYSLRSTANSYCCKPRPFTFYNSRPTLQLERIETTPRRHVVVPKDEDPKVQPSFHNSQFTYAPQSRNTFKTQRHQLLQDRRRERARRAQEATKLREINAVPLKSRLKNSAAWTKKFGAADGLLGLDEHNGQLNANSVEESYRLLKREAERGHSQSVEELAESIVKDSGKPPDLEIYSNLILANTGTNGSAAQVMLILQEMQKRHVTKNATIYENALKALAVHPDPLLRGYVLTDMREHWFSISLSGWHYLVAGYVREGQFEIALETLDDMLRANYTVENWLYDLIIASLCNAKELDEALAIVRYRTETSTEAISIAVWFSLFDLACENFHLPLIRYVWSQRVPTGKLIPSVGQCEQILHVAARNGDADIALKVFRFLGKARMNLKASHYQLLMEAYALNEDLDTALKITQMMDKAGLLQTSKAWWPLKELLLKSADDANQAMAILRTMVKEWQIPTQVINALIDTCVDSGNLDDAMSIYGQWLEFKGSQPNVDTFNSLFRGCAQERQKEPALALAHEMIERNVVADVRTYEYLIKICLAVRDHESALQYFAELRDTGLVADFAIASAVILRLAAIGDDRVFSVIEDVKLWGFDTSQLESSVAQSRSLKEEHEQATEQEPVN